MSGGGATGRHRGVLAQAADSTRCDSCGAAEDDEFLEDTGADGGPSPDDGDPFLDNLITSSDKPSHARERRPTRRRFELFRTNYQTGDVTCTRCGVVQKGGQLINTGKDWREFAEDGGIRGAGRRHAERTTDDLSDGLVTAISAGKSLFGAPGISSEQKGHTIALLKMQRKHQTSRAEVVLVEAFGRTTELCERLGLPGTVRHTAKEVLRSFDAEKQRQCVKTTRLKSDACLVAAVFLACRHQPGAGRSLRTLCRQSGTVEIDVRRFYKVLSKDPNVRARLEDSFAARVHAPTTSQSSSEAGGLPQSSPQQLTAGAIAPPPLPNGVRSNVETIQDLVGLYCSRLGMTFAAAREAKIVAARATQFLEGKKLSTVAAACVLFVADIIGFKTGPKEISSLCGVSNTTITATLRELSRRRAQLSPDLLGLTETPQQASLMDKGESSKGSVSLARLSAVPSHDEPEASLTVASEGSSALVNSTDLLANLTEGDEEVFSNDDWSIMMEDSLL